MFNIISNLFAIIGVPILFILVFYILCKLKKKQINLSTGDSLYIFIIVLTIFISCIICFIIGYKMLKIETNAEQLPPENQVLNDIINQQSITLAVTTLSATLAGVVNSVISVFRDKKIQKDEEQITKLRLSIEAMESAVKTISSISAIQILEAKDSEYFYDLITQYIEDTSGNNYSKLALLSLKSSISKRNIVGLDQEISCYTEIIDIASQIIKDSDNSIDKHFALLESTNALYKRARINLYTKDATDDLLLAKKQMNALQKLNPIDTYGHVYNLHGLVHFWTSKIASVNERNSELMSAKSYFELALKKYPDKVEYLNHLGVTYINLFELQGKEEDKDEAIKTFKRIIEINPNYSKAYTNYAHILLDQFKKSANISDSIGFSKSINNKLTQEIVNEANMLLDNAENKLKKAINLAPNFIDNYYKYGALLTYKYYIEKNQNPDFCNETIQKNIDNYFKKADKIITGATKTLVYKRNFHELIGEIETAKKINDDLINNGNKYAIEWQSNYDDVKKVFSFKDFFMNIFHSKEKL